jgi:Predicted P-loop-containing kinase
MSAPQLVLISGLSGSGKSIALNVLEDSGYYCVDNLPAKLLPEIAAYLRDAGYDRIAVSVDARGGEPVQELPARLLELREQGMDVRVLFLEANTETLVKRFSETRRRHPLSKDRLTVEEAIALERHLLDPLSQIAQRVDSSELGPNTLRAWVKDFIDYDHARIVLLFESFGYKNGIPLDADLVFDVRCLPNPYYDPQLRPQTGRDPDVIAFLEKQEGVQRMLDDIRRFVETWLPCFIRDNRSYLTVAVGCTGGRHRSVYLVETLADCFRGDQQVMVRHRNLP